MRSTIEKLMEMFEALFAGRYEAWQFSCDFPDFCFQNYDKLEAECKGLGYYLDQEVPDICDEGEPGFDPAHMKEELKKVYQKVKEFIKQ